MIVLSACSTPANESNLENQEGDNIFLEEVGDIAEFACTSPDEESCEACIRKTEDGSCVKLAWQGDESDDSLVEPWYNVNSLVDCSEDLPPCADCLKRDKSELNDLLENPNFQSCDCGEVDWENQIDACFMPSSCECLCGRYDRLSTACSVE